MNTETFIENNVLIKADNEKIVEIPYGVEIIEENAFYFNNNVKEVIIPTTVKEFRKNAMYCCFFLKYIKYQGTIEQWKEIKFNGVFSSPLYYGSYGSPLYFKKKFEFTNWKKCLPNSNSTYYSLIPEKTNEEITFEQNENNLFQTILLYYEDLSTNYGKELKKLYSGNSQNPILDDNSLIETSKFYKLDKQLVSNIITCFIKSNQIHYVEVVNFRKAIKGNQNGVFNFGFLNMYFSNHNVIEFENGNTTLVFINPTGMNSTDYNSNDFNSIVVNLLKNQIEFICEYFEISQNFDVRIEHWSTQPLFVIKTTEEFQNRTTKEKHLIKNYKEILDQVNKQLNDLYGSD